MKKGEPLGLNETIEKLESNKQLTPDECEKAREELDRMGELRKTKLLEVAMEHNIDELLSKFWDVANESKDLLNNAITTITNGQVPDVTTIEEMDNRIELLRDSYDSIQLLASSELSEEELPAPGAPVDKLSDAIKNSKSAILKLQLQEIKTTLEQFLKVQSLVEMFSDALKPFQEKAKLLLDDLAKEEITFEKAETESSKAALFMKAYGYGDLIDEEGKALFNQVTAEMNPTVALGLATKSYHLEEGAAIDVNENNQETPTDTGNVDVKESEPIVEAAVIEDAPATEIKALTIEQDEKDETEAKIDEETSDDETEEPSDFVIELQENGLILPDNSCFGTMRKAPNINEDKKISASIFSNDIRSGDEDAALQLLYVLCTQTSLSEHALASVTRMPHQLFENTVKLLLNKGYLNKYYSDNGEVLSPSLRLKAALSYESVSKKIGVKKNYLADHAPFKTGDENCLASLIAKSNILSELSERYPDKIRATMVCGEGSCLIFFTKHGSSENINLVLAEFWNDTEICDAFLTIVDDVIESEMRDYGIEDITFAAFNHEMAKKFADVLNKKLHLDMCTTKFRFYSLSEDSFEEETRPKPNIDKLKADEFDKFFEEDGDENTVDQPEITEPIEEAEDRPGNTDISADTYGVIDMLADKLFYAATAYAKAKAIEDSSKNVQYKQLMYAFNAPSDAEDNKKYSSSNLYELIATGSKIEQALVCAAAFRTFFSNQVQYDYNIRASYDALNDFEVLNKVPGLKLALYDISDFKHTYKKGLDFYADYHKKDQKKLESELATVQSEAKEFYEKNVSGIIKERTGHRRYMETLKLLFSPDGDLGQHLKLVVDGDKECTELIADFLKNNFFAPDSDLSEDNIDDAKIWDYIQVFWDDAGQLMSVQKRDDLKSHLRSNITSRTNRAVQILVKWVSLVTSQEGRNADEGEVAYKKIKKKLIENIVTALDSIDADLAKGSSDKENTACLQVLGYTLRELLSCLDGTFNEGEKQYFYADFLRTDEIMLDERYMPDFDVHSSDIEELLPKNRIYQHIRLLKEKAVSFEEHLQDITKGSDNCGTAKLIVQYLTVHNPNFDYNAYNAEIAETLGYVKETAKIRKDNFVGELELAQSYGQIDNSTEDQKEIILRAVDEWFEWACLSENYGFFKKVIESYMAAIRRNAKKREEDILEELEAYKSSNDSKTSIEAKQKKIAKIQSALKEQNYTVAEDLLSRDDFDEDIAVALIEDDFLKDFLDNYDDFYKPVASKTSSLANLIKNRIRTKEDRGAKRLAENWLPGGSRIGKNQLEKLLSALGFEVQEISEQKTVGRFEEYTVTTVGAFRRQRNSYTHPIAAFGSGAAETGFRVVCLNGIYDADKLIDLMKQIGDAKNVLILLDCALTIVERRKLARKTKTSLGDKLIAVLDRTVMMYLIKNYDETKINRMFVALVTPFAYYQPYVWESVNIMPPEIFMGRKIELEKIKSPTGVNIVYGGRQLGKSALLKKAKEDIDWDENGDRAVYIDIKGLNYKETALKVCQELVDQFVLDDTVETDDWSKLAREIKRRLQQDEKKIPYLLLLLDEADAFIESCGEVNYKPFDALKEVQSIGVGRFKFVVAGLRNIVRFKRDALANNSVLTHLEPLTVTPFSFSEARELLEVPLHYLGLRFPKEKESLVTLIMATTNYFPGLIQLYCAKLIDAMRNSDYAGYDEVDSPIYEVSEEHIKKVLADPEFMQQIREKFIITLRLDEDNQYYLIALIIAWLYHNDAQKKKMGYSAEDIKKVAKDYDISKFENVDATRIENLCEELRELNVLRKTSEHCFMFTRFTFFQMMGTADEVDNALAEYMGAGESNE